MKVGKIEKGKQGERQIKEKERKKELMNEQKKERKLTKPILCLFVNSQGKFAKGFQLCFTDE